MLTYAVLGALFRDYPDDSPVFFEFPISDEPMSKGAFTVGQIRARCAAKPAQGVPLIPTEGGRHQIVGIHFREDGPILLLTPFDGEQS